MELLSFGDVFRYREDLYVYLSSSDGIVYAAKILDKMISQELERLSERRASRGEQVDSFKQFCFVVLTTHPYEECAANFGLPELNGDPENKICALNDSDVQLLKKEILASRGVPLRLKELVKQLESVSEV